MLLKLVLSCVSWFQKIQFGLLRYCDIAILWYCGSICCLAALFPLWANLAPKCTNFDWWRYLLLFLTLSPSNKSLWHGRRTQLIDATTFWFFCMWEQGGGAKCQSPSFIQAPFCGRGAPQKIPQKSFSASKVQIPLQRLSSSTLQHAANLQLCRIMFNLQIKTTLLQHALRVKAPHILGRSETRWHFLFYICNTPIRIMKFGIGGLGPNQIFLFLDAVTSPAPSPMCI